MDPGDPARPGSGYRSRFDHKHEQANPGYYAVTLADSGIRAELTAGSRIGVHRYRFPAGKAAHLLIDLRTSLYNYPGKILWSGFAPAPRWHRHGIPRNARLGTGAQAVFRDALFPAAKGSRLCRSRSGGDVQGVSGSGTRQRCGRGKAGARAGGAARFRHADRPARGPGGAVGSRRRRRGRQPRCRNRRFRRRPCAHHGRLVTRAGCGRDQRLSSDAHVGLHRALPCVARAEHLERRRWSLSRSRRPDAQGGRLHVPVDLFALGHVPCRTSTAHARPARTDDHRRRPIADRKPPPQFRWHPARLAIRGAGGRGR